MYRYRHISGLISAIENCKKSGNQEWLDKHMARLQGIVSDTAPSGSGFNNGTKLDLDASTPEKLVFSTAFHHMDENGGYDGWTQHRVIVRPSLMHDIVLTVSGRDRNEIKEYIDQTFDVWLKADI